MSLKPEPWEDDAACRRVTRWGHLDGDAKVKVCDGCPVRTPCARLGIAVAAEYGITSRDAGAEVYGGRRIHALPKSLA